MRNIYLLAVLAWAGSAQAGTPPAVGEIHYIGCPIYRDVDAGKKSGCWLADDRETGVRYDVSMAPDKPDWDFAVLVEGKEAQPARSNACGGVLLDPVRVAVLRDQPCTRAELPAENYPGHPFVQPARLIMPEFIPRKPFPRPYQTRQFSVPFGYNRAFITYQLADYYVDQAVAYALATHARAVNITGWAATDPEIVSGQSLRENPEIGWARAEMIEKWMINLGVPAARLHLQWLGDAKPAAVPGADGLQAPSRRRADIEVVPGSAAP